MLITHIKQLKLKPPVRCDKGVPIPLYPGYTLRRSMKLFIISYLKKFYWNRQCNTCHAVESVKIDQQ